MSHKTPYFLNTPPERPALFRTSKQLRTEPDERSPSPKKDYYEFLTYGEKILAKTGYSRISSGTKSIESNLSTDYELTPQKGSGNSSIGKSEDLVSSETYKDLAFENKRLKTEITTLEIREKSHLAKLSTLEKEKSLLIEALSQTQSKLQEYSSRLKEEKKKANGAIQSIKASLVLELPVSNSKDTQTDEPTFSTNNSNKNFSPFKLGVRDEDVQRNLLRSFEGQRSLNSSIVKDLAEENKSRVEVEDLKKYIEHLKTQSTIHEEIRRDLIDKNTQLIKENKRLKLFLKGVSDLKNDKDPDPENVRTEKQSIASSKIKTERRVQ